MVYLDGLACSCNYVHRGIAAGCSFATFLVQMLVLPGLREWRSRHTDVLLTMFIDDLFVQARHRRLSQLVLRLTESAADLRRIIEDEW